MTATILEFSSVRNLLDGVALSSAGLADVAHWQLCGVPGDTYEVSGLIAEPGLVAVSRTKGLCIVHFLAGRRRDLTVEERLTAQLNAAVCAEVVPFGYGLQITARWVFDDDESYVDRVFSAGDLVGVLSSTRQRLFDKGCDRALTHDAARAISRQSP